MKNMTKGLNKCRQCGRFVRFLKKDKKFICDICKYSYNEGYIDETGDVQ